MGLIIQTLLPLISHNEAKVFKAEFCFQFLSGSRTSSFSGMDSNVFIE